MYFLVLLQDLHPDHAVDHEPFIDSLIARNVILLGGGFDDPPRPGIGAAYVLRHDSLAEAEATVATDPLVRSGAVIATVTAWDLVGINAAAIDPDLQV
jgi:uncharacterized protein YciI